MNNVFSNISLYPTDRDKMQIAEDYRKAVPSAPASLIGTVINVNSRFLPFYYDEGLLQDMLWMVISPYETISHEYTALIKNNDIRSLDITDSSGSSSYLKAELRKHIDCVYPIRYRSYVNSTYDLDKALKCLSTTLLTDNDMHRAVPVLITDNTSRIPDELPAYFIIPGEGVISEDTSKVRTLLGEINYKLIKFAEDNPGSAKDLVKHSITQARTLLEGSEVYDISDSMVMAISTAVILKNHQFFTDTDIEQLLEWFGSNASSRTAQADSLRKKLSDVLSDDILSDRLSISAQFGPPYWNESMAFVTSDGSVNMTTAVLERLVRKVSASSSSQKLIQVLSKEGLCFHDKNSLQKSRTVRTSDRGNISQRFDSLSNELLSNEAKSFIERRLISDRFHSPDKLPDNFRPYIIDERYGLIAGAVVTDYKSGTPQIGVSGASGTGKTDWMMIQLQLCMLAGDTVVVLEPTNAFTREELRGHCIPDELIDEHFTFWDMSTEGFPIDLLDFTGCENIEQKTAWLSSLLISGLHLTGPKEIATLESKIRAWLESGKADDLNMLPKLFERCGRNCSLHTKIKGLFSTVKTTDVTPSSWDKLLTKPGKALVISCGNATANTTTNPLDIILDSLYSYKDIHRDSKVMLVLDEFQTLNLRSGCTLETIFRLGRKLNLSAMLASQSYSDDDRDNRGRFYALCGTNVFFCPAGTSSLMAAARTTHISADILRDLPDFHCAVMGSIFSSHDGKNKKLDHAVTGKTYRPPSVGDYDDEV